MPKRVRVIIYTHATQEQLDRQRMNDTRTHLWGPNQIESFELNPLHMTILELIRLFWREARHGD
jgi:hypothetical protein